MSNLYVLKGFDVAAGGGIDLISHIIKRHLKIDVSVLMGANLANEIADENFSETTIGRKKIFIKTKMFLLFKIVFF